MDEENKKPALGGGLKEQNKTCEKKSSTLKPGTKIYNVAAALARGERLDCFQAVSRYHDYVLRSTISEIANRFGVSIDRMPKTVPGHGGSVVNCIEYTASEEGAKQLARLLGWAA